jgi:hypothetical protein
MVGTALRDRGRFSGYRVNVEDVPRLPAYVARYVLEDRRQRPYLALWTSYSWGTGDGVALAVRVTAEGDAVRLESHGFSGRALVVRRPIPGGKVATFWRCPSCARPVRFLYVHQVTARGLHPSGPRCSRCNNLRWSSQGRTMLPGQRQLGPLPRQPWDPVACVSSPAVLEAQYPELARLLGLGVTGTAARWPTARAEEAIRRTLGRTSRQLARLEALLRRGMQ